MRRDHSHLHKIPPAHVEVVLCDVQFDWSFLAPTCLQTSKSAYTIDYYQFKNGTERKVIWTIQGNQTPYILPQAHWAHATHWESFYSEPRLHVLTEFLRNKNLPCQIALGNSQSSHTYYWQELWIEEELGVSHTHGHDQLPLVCPFIRGDLWSAEQHTVF